MKFWGNNEEAERLAREHGRKRWVMFFVKLLVLGALIVGGYYLYRHFAGSRPVAQASAVAVDQGSEVAEVASVPPVAKTKVVAEPVSKSSVVETSAAFGE